MGAIHLQFRHRPHNAHFAVPAEVGKRQRGRI
jgi:hypothetical protein